VEDQVAEGRKVVTRWQVQATNTGPFLRIPPTGRRVQISGINIFRVVDQTIVEGWHNLDVLGMLQQLRIIPAPASLPSSQGEAPSPAVRP